MGKSKKLLKRITNSRLLKPLRRVPKRPLIIVVSFAVIGVVIMIYTRAAAPQISLEAENLTRSAGASRVEDSLASDGWALRFSPVVGSNGINRRFFADDASWNRPVSDFGRSTALEQYADRFWNYAGAPAAPGDTNVQFKNYSVPIYDMSKANDSVQVFQTIWSQNQQGFSTTGSKIGDTIPWNSVWIPGPGRDRILSIVDYSLGKVIELWVVDEPAAACNDKSILGIAALDGPNTKAGYNPSNPKHKCIGAMSTYDNLYTAKEGSTVRRRGMGINKLALVTRAQEVLNGKIEHALELTISATMFGAPNCAPDNNASAAGAGTNCGFYLPPATRVEFATNENNRIDTRCDPTPTSVTPAGRAKTVPEGMRIALNINDAAIEQWLTSRGYTGAKRNTARIFAVALRDYGAVVAETGCFAIGIETDGLMNADTAADWAGLGITDIPGNTSPHGDLLDGLFTRDRLYVVNPPN